MSDALTFLLLFKTGLENDVRPRSHEAHVWGFGGTFKALRSAYELLSFREAQD
jgi:Fe-S oxidoreductase